MREQTIMYGVMINNLRPDLPVETEEEAPAPEGGAAAVGDAAAGAGDSGGSGKSRAGTLNANSGSVATTAAVPRDNATAATGVHETAGVSSGGLTRVVGNGRFPELCPGWKDLMVRSWSEVPAARPDFDHIVKQLEGMVKAMDATDGNVTPRRDTT